MFKNKAHDILEASKKSVIASILIFLFTLIIPLGELGGLFHAFLALPLLCAYAGYEATKKLKLGLADAALAGLLVIVATEVVTFFPQLFLESLGYLPPGTLAALSSGDFTVFLIYYAIEAFVGVFFGAVGAFIG